MPNFEIREANNPKQKNLKEYWYKFYSQSPGAAEFNGRHLLNQSRKILCSHEEN